MEKKDRAGSVEWKVLLGCAKAALDEQGFEEYEKRKVSFEKRRQRVIDFTGMKDVPYDAYLVQEALVRFDRSKKEVESCRAVGVRQDHLRRACELDADAKLVYDFIRENLEMRLEARARDIALDAQETLERGIRDGNEKVNQRLVICGLKSGAKKVYGDAEDAKAKERAMARSVVYNLPGLTVNLINAPKEMLGERLESAVDVEAEVVRCG